MGWYYEADDGDDEKNFVEQSLESALIPDDPHEFISLVEANKESAGSICSVLSPHMRLAKLTQSSVLDGIITNGALRCATAFLEGKTCLSVDVNATIHYGRHPLYIATFLLNYDLVDLFLRHCADTDQRNGLGEPLLPIEVALKRFYSELEETDPASNESIINLFAALCHIQMNIPLETVRLLAWWTKNFCNVFNNYAKEGKLVEMTVLLIVAKDRLMPRNTLQSNDGSNANASMRIHKNIRKELRSLSVAQRKLSIGQRSEFVQKCETKRVALISALDLLDLFEKAGDAIGLYFKSQPINVPKEKVAKDIVAMVEKAGCALKDIDLRNIDCKSSEIMEAARTLETEKGTADGSPPLLGLPMHPPSVMFRDAKLKSWSWPPGMQVEQMSISYPPWSSALQSDLPANRGVRHYSGYDKLTEAQSKGETTATPRPVWPRSKPYSPLAPIALAFKRGMRHL